MVVFSLSLPRYRFFIFFIFFMRVEIRTAFRFDKFGSYIKKRSRGPRRDDRLPRRTGRRGDGTGHAENGETKNPRNLRAVSERVSLSFYNIAILHYYYCYCRGHRRRERNNRFRSFFRRLSFGMDRHWRGSAIN